MLPSEIIILMAIAVNNNNGKKMLTRPMDVTGEYIGYLYHSLVKRGYLKRRSSSVYYLTPTGRETILEFLNKNKTRAEDVMKRLQLLGIEMSPKQEQEIDKLKRESSKIK